MDPQWIVFQPPISEPSILDYNHRSMSSHSNAATNNHSLSNNLTNSHSHSNIIGNNHSHQNPVNSTHSIPNPVTNNLSHPNTMTSNRYNGYYDSSTGTHNTSIPPPSSHLNARQTQPPSTSPHHMFNTNPTSSPISQQPPPTSPQIPQPNNYFSSNSSYNSSNNPNSPGSFNPPMPDFKIGTFTLNANGYPNESNGVENVKNSYSSSNSNGMYSSSNNSSLYNQNNDSVNAYCQNGTNDFSCQSGYIKDLKENDVKVTNTSNNQQQTARETGIIEKLLVSYFFLFFNYRKV